MTKRRGPESDFEENGGPLFDLSGNGRHLLPVHNGTPTSIAAAESIRPHAETQRHKILEFVRTRDEIGATREDIELALEMNGSTVRPRVLELIARGLLRETDVTRATSSGRQAVVLFSCEVIP